MEHWDVLQDGATKAGIQKRFADVWRSDRCLNQLFHPFPAIDHGPSEALHKLGNKESGAAFVRSSGLH